MHHYHEKVNNEVREKTSAENRGEIWIVKGRGLLKKVIKDCLHYKRLRTKPIPPLISDLPYDRIELVNRHSITAELTTLELFSWSNLGEQDWQQEKRNRGEHYFTCLNTRAMHPKIIWDLATDVFILGHRRFYSKRQYPYIILGDNGKWTEEEVNNNQTNWLFNPPRSPWMSGAMESMVKTTKAALKQS